MTRLTKQDWEDLAKNAEMTLKQIEIQELQYTQLLEIAKTNMGRLGNDETKEVEEEVKELVDEVKDEDGEPTSE